MVNVGTVVNWIDLTASGLPDRSVMLPVCKHTLYNVFPVSNVLGVIVRVLLLIFNLVGILVVVPVFRRSIHIVPSFMGSLNVILIVLFVFIFLALLLGLDEVIIGFVPSVVNLSEVSSMGLPDASVMLPVCMHSW